MELIWLGHSGFRIKSREASIVTDPPPFEGRPAAALEADLVTMSHRHTGHANLAAVKGKPLVFDGPGEYESQEVLILGLSTYHDDVRGERLGKNTIFRIELESLAVCHLGDLGHGLTPELTEALGSIDILLVPVGGGTTINAAKAAETVSLMEPKIVIPMHYREGDQRQDLDLLDKFLSEMGVKDPVVQPRLSVTRSTLPQETQIVVLEARRS